MSTAATVDLGHFGTETETAHHKPSLFDAVIATRERQGKAYVKAYLTRQSDSTLSSLGFKPDQIEAIRKTGEIPASFWR